MATHSSVLAWRIPGTGKPGGLPSMGSHRVGHDWSNLAAAAACVSLHSVSCSSKWSSTGMRLWECQFTSFGSEYGWQVGLAIGIWSRRRGDAVFWDWALNLWVMVLLQQQTVLELSETAGHPPGVTELLDEWKTHSAGVRSTTSREKTEKEYAFFLLLFGWFAGLLQELSAQSWYLHAWSGGGSKEMVWIRRDENKPGETFETP